MCKNANLSNWDSRRTARYSIYSTSDTRTYTHTRDIFRRPIIDEARITIVRSTTLCLRFIVADTFAAGYKTKLQTTVGLEIDHVSMES